MGLELKTSEGMAVYGVCIDEFFADRTGRARPLEIDAYGESDGRFDAIVRIDDRIVIDGTHVHVDLETSRASQLSLRVESSESLSSELDFDKSAVSRLARSLQQTCDLKFQQPISYERTGIA